MQTGPSVPNRAAPTQPQAAEAEREQAGLCEVSTVQAVALSPRAAQRRLQKLPAGCPWGSELCGAGCPPRLVCPVEDKTWPGQIAKGATEGSGVTVVGCET